MLTKLTHLNCSNSKFVWTSIANLTNLVSLDFSCDFEVFLNFDLVLKERCSSTWVSQLSNLRELYIEHVDVS